MVCDEHSNIAPSKGTSLLRGGNVACHVLVEIYCSVLMLVVRGISFRHVPTFLAAVCNLLAVRPPERPGGWGGVNRLSISLIAEIAKFSVLSS